MPGPEWLNAERPFPGLRPFSYEDRDYFFGREDQIYALYGLLELSRFVAVVGSSGSGKSSLVRAGLLPLLESETLELDEDAGSATRRKWRWIEIRPGDAPISRLAGELARLGVSDETKALESAALRERVEYSLRRSSFGMRDAIAGIGNVADSSLLIVVDQFEELFRYGGSGAGHSRLQEERQHFVELLLQATSSRDDDVHVLITMRSDFIGDCALFTGLPEAVSTCQYLVPALSRDHREQVILGPLDEHHANAAIEPALVQRLLNDSGGELDQLPVLQHCLSRLWEASGPSNEQPPRRQLRLEHYDEVGGLAEALSRHADEILAGLAGHEIAIEQVFRALSEVDAEGRATRRALTFEDLREETGIGTEELRLVADRFRSADCSFLVPSVTAVPVLTDDLTVDIGHEALLRRWRRLGAEATESFEEDRRAGWLEAEADDARIYRAMVTLASPTSAAVLPLDQVDSRWAWWNERPRTAAWAERYGGELERVERLFRNSLRAKRWHAVRRVATATVTAVLVGGFGLHLYWQELKEAAMAKTAIEGRSAVLNELTDITQQLSTEMRFIPGTNGATSRILDRVQDFSRKFSQWLETKNPNGVDPIDQRVKARLELTARIMKADYEINFGKIGGAIRILDDAEALLKSVPGADADRPLRLLKADIALHRASGRVLYGDFDAARRDYDTAERILTNLAGDGKTASKSKAADQDIEYRRAARKRLARLYRGWVFYNTQYLNDAKAAEKDYKALDRVVSEATAAEHERKPADEAEQKFWAEEGRGLRRRYADVQLANGDVDEAIKFYEKIVDRMKPQSASVMTRIRNAFVNYRFGFALSQRAQGKDLANALTYLNRAKNDFSFLAEMDPKNSWWHRLSRWINLALGATYRKQNDFHNASLAFHEAKSRSKILHDMDPSNPAMRQAVDQDTALAAQAANDANGIRRVRH